MPYMSERKKALRRLKTAISNQMMHGADEIRVSSADNEEESHSSSSDDDLDIFVLAESETFSKRYIIPREMVHKSS